ncbi:ac117-like protein [Cryptophlebia peltastica nucleopolyhedrovirus]|uniref:Ac117-like protein n=1 Tax=Cryptophlebia peltastica nucleopolyhedrovirus TaxID=2304025 RepID=A0A346RNW1_9ABAC|nr:ac117-like protein [Cryptophlebia peltastica nucleopolyhedrovirus]AXS67758.1 ac117-like protein [Cryptophlebia peltastica nucleopolyhedrovirus]
MNLIAYVLSIPNNKNYNGREIYEKCLMNLDIIDAVMSRHGQCLAVGITTTPADMVSETIGNDYMNVIDVKPYEYCDDLVEKIYKVVETYDNI